MGRYKEALKGLRVPRVRVADDPVITYESIGDEGVLLVNADEHTVGTVWEKEHLVDGHWQLIPGVWCARLPDEFVPVRWQFTSREAAGDFLVYMAETLSRGRLA